MDLPERRQRALRKAFALGLQADVEQLRPRLYRVASTSRAGLAHRVAVTSRGGEEYLACSCEAGLIGQPCVHAAAVWLRRLEARSGASVLYVHPPQH
jgi:hypothetical protein